MVMVLITTLALVMIMKMVTLMLTVSVTGLAIVTDSKQQHLEPPPPTYFLRLARISSKVSMPSLLASESLSAF